MEKSDLLFIDDVYDNEYLSKYIALINENINTKKQSYRTQLHHITPKSYYKNHNLVINNSKDNLVNLLWQDHMLAHFYLFKCAKDSKFKADNATVIQLGVNNKYNLDSEEELLMILPELQEAYEYAIVNRRIYEEKRLLSLRAPGTRKKMSSSAKKYFEINGPRITKSTKDKHHYTNGVDNVFKYTCPEGYRVGWSLSEESKYAMNPANQNRSSESFHTTDGTIVINNGKNNKHIKENELDMYLNSGEWFKGSLVKDTGKWYTNGIINTKIVAGKDIPEGFKPGITGDKEGVHCKLIINSNEYSFCSKAKLFKFLYDKCYHPDQNSIKSFIQMIDRKLKRLNTNKLELVFEDKQTIIQFIV